MAKDQDSVVKDEQSLLEFLELKPKEPKEGHAAHPYCPQLQR